MPNPAAIAYEAYRTVRNADPTQGEYLLPWDMLSPEHKTAWWAVVRALVELHNPPVEVRSPPLNQSNLELGA